MAAQIKELKTIPAEKIKPLSHLTVSQKKIWRSLVNVMPDKHFIQSDFPIMEAYVVGIDYMRDAALKIKESDQDEVSPWLKVFESQQSRLGNLAVKLRLAPNARARVDLYKPEDKKKVKRDLG